MRCAKLGANESSPLAALLHPDMIYWLTGGETTSMTELSALLAKQSSLVHRLLPFERPAVSMFAWVHP